LKLSLLAKFFKHDFVAVIVMLAVFNNAIGQTQKGDPQKSKGVPNSAETVASALWQKFSVACPIPGESPATFVAFPHERSPSLITELVEFRGAWKKVVSLNLTEADRLNGVQARAIALMGGSAARKSKDWEGSLTWSAWRDISKKSIPETLKDLNYRDIYAPIVLVIEKHNDQWYCTERPWSKKLFELGSLDPVPLSCTKLIGEQLSTAH